MTNKTNMTRMIDAQAQHASQTNDTHAYELLDALVKYDHEIFTNFEHEFSIIEFVIDNRNSICPAIMSYCLANDMLDCQS